MTSRGRLLLEAQRPGEPLGPPPEWFSADDVQAWHDIVAAVPGDVFRRQDSIQLEILARSLAAWRKGELTGVGLPRRMYRQLGDLLMPMAARRSLLFPAARPSRSQRV